jgi:ABC-type sugar transport systems, ATPase components
MSEGELDVLLGVRPEDTVVSREFKAALGNVKSRIEVVEPLGSETILNVKIGDELIKVKQPPGKLFQPGDEVYLEFNLKKALLFSRRNGRLLA